MKNYFLMFTGAVPNPQEGDDVKILPPKPPKPKTPVEEPKNTDEICSIHGSDTSNCCKLPIAHQIRFLSGSKEDNLVKVIATALKQQWKN